MNNIKCKFIKIFFLFLILNLIFSNMVSGANKKIEGPGKSIIPENVTTRDVSEEMLNSSYWGEKPGYDKVIMSYDKIKEINKKILYDPDCVMNDLENIEISFNGVDLRKKLSEFSNPKNLYINGMPVSETIYESIRTNIKNIKATEIMYVAYGFCRKRCVMRQLPTNIDFSDDYSDNEWSELSLSSVLLGEPLICYFTTPDGLFTYVKNEICDGWVPTDAIVLCHSRDEWVEAKDPKDFVIITGPKVVTDYSYNSEHSKVFLDMGTKLELCKEDTQMVDNRLSLYNLVVYMPNRGMDGCFEKQKMLIPYGSDVSIGYMSFTKKNIIEQAFKMLGRRYGWGGSYEAQDCSSFTREIYLCFGFVLPRNTTRQKNMKVNVTDVTGKMNGEKKHILNNSNIGSILFFPGHVMIYIGEKNNKHYVIDSVSSIGADSNEGIAKVRVRTIIINSLENTMRMSGHLWLDDLTHIISLY